MSKRNFDDIVSKDLGTIDKKSQSKQAVEAFAGFKNGEIPGEVEAYNWKGTELLIEVFSFKPESELSLKVTHDRDHMGNSVYLPIARVLANGPDSDYKVGDIVKLNDSDVTTVENPKYKDWVKNELSNSNMKQKGDEPIRFGSNIVKTLGPSLFTLNPLKRDGEDLEALYFKVTDRRIENLIKNVDILLNSI